MAGSRRCLRLLLFGAVLCALHSTDAATTVSSPPMLRYYTVPITMPFNEGTLIQNSTGQLTSNSGATWRFNTLQQPPTASISYGQLLHTPYVQNADCIFTSVSSNYSTVDVFLSSLLGINKTTDINTGVMNSSLAYRIGSTSVNDTRSTSELVKLNSTGITTLAIVNTGGQTKDHGSNNTAGDTLVSYRLGAYETESPVCNDAANYGGITTLPKPGLGSTLALYDDDVIYAREARMVTAFQNTSCVAFQLLGLLPYNDFNGSAYIPPAEIQRDMSVFLTTTSDAVAWAKGSFVGIPPLQGTMCQQLTQPALEASNLGQSNYTDTFGYGTTAQNIRPGTPNVTMITSRQTCQIAVDNMDPTQQYVLWAVNGLQASNASNTTARVKWAARMEGSCANLQFAAPFATGEPLPLGVAPIRQSGPVAAPPPQNGVGGRANPLAAPLGAPAPAADAPTAASVPLPPITGRVALAPGPPSHMISSSAPGPDAPFLPAKIVQLVPSPPPPLAPPPPPSQVAASGSTSSGSGGSKSGTSLSGGAIAGVVVGGLIGMAATGAAGFVLGRRSAAKGLTKAADGGQNGFYAMPHDPKPGSLDEQTGVHAMGQPLKSWTASSEEPPGAFKMGPPVGDSSSDWTSHDPATTVPGSQPGLRTKSVSGTHSGPSNANPRSYLLNGMGSPAGSASDGWQIPGEEIQYVMNSGKPVMLGSGSFGQVYKAKLGRVQDVAVKEIRRELDPDERRRLQQHLFGEIALLRRCRHRNIVTFKGISYKDGHVLLVMEEMATDLFHALKSVDSPFTWRGGRGQEVVLGIAQGLAYLHWRKVIHFDLKSANVLLTRGGEAKITDVGLSQVLAPGLTHLSQQQGYTLPWAAPEVLLNLECKPSADIYSFGVVLWEVVTGGVPRRGQLRPPRFVSLLFTLPLSPSTNSTVQGMDPFYRVPEECPADMVELWQRCVHEDPEMRPSAADIVHLLEQM